MSCLLSREGICVRALMVTLQTEATCTRHAMVMQSNTTAGFSKGTTYTHCSKHITADVNIPCS